MAVMPNHHLPSYGRADRSSWEPTPMTVAPPSHPPQPGQPESISEQLLKRMHAVPDAQREWIAQVDTRSVSG